MIPHNSKSDLPLVSRPRTPSILLVTLTMMQFSFITQLAMFIQKYCARAIETWQSIRMAQKLAHNAFTARIWWPTIPPSFVQIS